jgi:OOP family OmpA-OmpF porin
MNYSTLKKTVYLSFVSLMAVGFASAQTTSMSDSVTTAKVFGGAKQYNTWSVGVNVGVAVPSVFTGGVNPFTHNTVSGPSFGVSLKDQISHAFSIRFDFNGGKISGNDAGSSAQPPATATFDVNTHIAYAGFSTQYYSGALSGVVNVGNISFLHRKNSLGFYVSGGAGIAYYKPTPIEYNSNANVQTGAPQTATPYDHYIKELIIPVGAGVKFRLTEQLDLNVGYTENFLDGVNLTGVHAKFPAENRYSYGYAGLEYTFGSKSKPSLEWVNPVAMMYDELYDAALRAEVEALKGRVTKVETAVNDLKKDSDGDGVADQFDKCPNTPANTVVDGSGCPIIFPKGLDTAYLSTIYEKLHPKATVAAYSNIQFEFDSSVLKTSSYPVLDATSADLRTSGATCELDGFASSEGTAAHNMRLSKDRANSVKTYLVNSGVDAKKLKVKPFGETRPIADNSTEEGRVLNRRVEFKK